MERIYDDGRASYPLASKYQEIFFYDVLRRILNFFIPIKIIKTARFFIYRLHDDHDDIGEMPPKFI